MTVDEERLVCIDHECGAEFKVRRKPALKKIKLRCACGGELKRFYHPPVLTFYGTVIGKCPTKC
jgi:hypothetical protein